MWGRIEGHPNPEDDPIGGPSLVYGFFEVPPGSKVDLHFNGRTFPAKFKEDFGLSAVFQVEGIVSTFQKADFLVIARKDASGAVRPDSYSRKAAKEVILRYRNRTRVK